MRHELRHLVARFFGSLGRAEPSTTQLAWLDAKLSPAESDQLAAMSVADRRHAVACARQIEALLGEAVSDELIVASALHDVGKTEAGLGTPGRVVATVVGRLVPRAWRVDWIRGRGWRHAFAVYLSHDVRGAELLDEIGSAPMVVAWAREHHLDEADWSIPPDLGRSLAEADLVSSLDI